MKTKIDGVSVENIMSHELWKGTRHGKSQKSNLNDSNQTQATDAHQKMVTPTLPRRGQDITSESKNQENKTLEGNH